MSIKLIITFLIGFLIVALAANEIAKQFQKNKFPLITGLIITGIIAGSSFLNFIPTKAIKQLNFLNEIALSIIAFSAGSELYLKELRSRINSIKWMTIGQLVITFVLSTLIIYWASDLIPFMAAMPATHKMAIAILFATIFVARSPSSAIAIIDELRANGPFTKTVMGVTVIKDVLVIIVFAISLSIAKAFIHDEPINFIFFVLLLSEILLSIGLGILIGKLLTLPFKTKADTQLKGIAIAVIGYAIYLFSHLISFEVRNFLNAEFDLEPLLMAIIASFYVTNYSPHRIEFTKALKEISPLIYIIFFTLTGASLSVHTLINVFNIAIAFFFLRLLTMFLGGISGVILANDAKKYLFIAWMPYLTQAGVALGLATIISHEFPEWGNNFETIVIALVVMNQLIGPPLFKWSLNYLKESHLKAKNIIANQKAIIFGIEPQSVALSQQLQKNKWEVNLVQCKPENTLSENNLPIQSIKSINKQELTLLNLKDYHAVILLLSDDENLKLATYLYEEIGNPVVIVRLNDRSYFEKFHQLGVLIINPATAMVSLLDHFVRSPNAASLLLGLDQQQDTIDIEIKNSDIHGLPLRELRFPADVLVLSVKRKGQLLVSHGYTRLRLGDIITLVGNEDTLQKLKFKFDS
ncbi:MAG: monovalent cation:proton antiporter family protein [Lutibacter sp.]